MSDIHEDDYLLSEEEQLHNAVKSVYPFAVQTTPTTWWTTKKHHSPELVATLNQKLPPAYEASLVGQFGNDVEVQVQYRTVVYPHPIRAVVLMVLTFLSVWFSWERYGPQSLWAGDSEAAFIGAVGIVAILVAHEIGHYLALRRHNVAGMYPHLIPLPLWWGGTLGGFVIGETVPNRRAAFELAMSGPLAGLLVAIPVAIIGLQWSGRAYVFNNIPMFESSSLLWNGLVAWFAPAGNGSVLLHPLGAAGYLGLFLTGLNLLPLFPLDGGRWVFSLLPSVVRPAFTVLVSIGVLWFAFSTSLITGIVLTGFALGAVPHWKRGIAADDVTPLPIPLALFVAVVWLVLLVLLYDTIPLERFLYQS